MQFREGEETVYGPVNVTVEAFRDAEERLRRYARSVPLDYMRHGPRPHPTLARLAQDLGLAVPVLRHALDMLTERGEIQVLIHPGGRYELRPARHLQFA